MFDTHDIDQMSSAMSGHVAGGCGLRLVVSIHVTVRCGCFWTYVTYGHLRSTYVGIPFPQRDTTRNSI